MRKNGKEKWKSTEGFVFAVATETFHCRKSLVRLSLSLSPKIFCRRYTVSSDDNGAALGQRGGGGWEKIKNLAIKYARCRKLDGPMVWG